MLMKLQDLKTEARLLWETLNLIDGTELTAEPFEVAMRKKGDLRFRATWETAAVELEALCFLGGVDNCDLIRYLAQPDSPIAQAYPDRLLDAIVGHPAGLMQLQNGLKRLYADPLAPGDRECAWMVLKQLAECEVVNLELPLPMLQVA